LMHEKIMALRERLLMYLKRNRLQDPSSLILKISFLLLMWERRLLKLRREWLMK